MKILATSDTHGNLDNLDLTGIDLALFAGDIALLKGLGAWDVYEQLKWMNTVFFDFCNKWSTIKIVVVPGNHDLFPLIKERFGTKLHGKSLELKLAPNATLLIDRLVEINGLKIYGSPWVPIISYRWAFEAESDKLREKFMQIPEGVDILLTHTPPRFNHLDVSLEYGPDSDKFGSSELADAIFIKKPKMCFCGHIHSGNHEMNKLNESEIWNVARVNESYNIAYEPLLIEV
jgi:Icc-related predicted phosphoesterase